MGQIYISYSQNNKEAALQIRDALEGWGHSVVMDDPDDPFDQELAGKLDRGLREAQVFIALLSPSSVHSRTVRREIAIAKDLDKFIVPVMVEQLPSVVESAGGKYIDATANLDVALSRLVKIADTHATRSFPSESLDLDDEAEDDDDERRLNPLVVGGIIIAILIVIVFAVIAFINQRPPVGQLPVDEIATATSQAIVATDMKLTINARATEAANLKAAGDEQATQAAAAQATANAQAATIAALELTQSAVPLSTNTVAPTEEPPTVTPVIIETVALSGPADEPTPTMEQLFSVDTEVPSSPVPAETMSSAGSSPTPIVSSGQSLGANALVNPGFESFAPVAGLGQVAQGWTPWSITGGGAPSYQLAPAYDAIGSNTARIHGGINGQQYGSEFATHDGGLYQRVTGIVPGATVRFSVWAYIWSSSYTDVNRSEGPGDVTFQVGIDPTGDTDGTSAAIIWSEPVENYDAFKEYAVTTTATGNAVTVFIRSTVGFPSLVSTIYVDDAQLVIG